MIRKIEIKGSETVHQKRKDVSKPMSLREYSRQMKSIGFTKKKFNKLFSFPPQMARFYKNSSAQKVVIWNVL